jgi:hypothetical protein
MSSDCIDICDCVYEVMCGECPHLAYCQNADDEMNHYQMLICMGSLYMKDGKYPDDFTPLLSEEEMIDVMCTEREILSCGCDK